jgi:ketosteroid isomerase-like protein
MTNKEIVLTFVKAINEHDADKIFDLMSDDHVFIDGYGNRQDGRNGMKESWQNYYQLFPDYGVEITESIENDSVVGLFGYASGTYNINNEMTNINFWKTTAAWKAIVENQKIKLWQVYCDYTRLMEIIKKEQKEQT